MKRGGGNRVHAVAQLLKLDVDFLDHRFEISPGEAASIDSRLVGGDADPPAGGADQCQDACDPGFQFDLFRPVEMVDLPHQCAVPVQDQPRHERGRRVEFDTRHPDAGIDKTAPWPHVQVPALSRSGAAAVSAKDTEIARTRHRFVDGHDLDEQDPVGKARPAVFGAVSFMCGIIAIIGTEPVAPVLVDGLKRLAYRGYDSAGIATLVNGHIDRRRAEGKIENLEARVAAEPIAGTVGIGHTRWATHGAPTEVNAHPHATSRVAVVHNGIIENYQALKEELGAHQHRFESETDTEIVAHLVTHYLDRGLAPVEAAAAAFARLEGAFSLAVLFAGEHGLIVGARQGTPLAIGHGDGAMYLGSDALALAPLTDRLTYLEDGDWAVLTREGGEVRDAGGAIVERPMRVTEVSGASVSKGGYRHYMLKEIYEQPEAIGDTLTSYVHPSTGEMALPPLPFDLADIPRITIVACGTAYYAGMVARFWLEHFARIPVDVDIASEFRYRAAPLPPGGVAVFISQSGETLDTLEALRYARREGQHILSVINVPESTIARESDAVLPTRAGPEIGVASTKAFTSQLTVLACLALAVGRAKGTIGPEMEAEIAQALREVPARAADVLQHDDSIRDLAQEIAAARDVFYLGRGAGYPIALEGALKLKEISYIHAEGYAAGEIKHGPIALIADSVPVVVVAPRDQLFEKIASNVQEIRARGGRVMLLADSAGVARLNGQATWTVDLPDVHPLVAPILYAIPVQLLAYHVAVIKGTDVDQPRNLAKSVTVE